MGDSRRRWPVAALAAIVALSPIAATRVAADGLAADDAYSVAEDAPGGLTVTADIGVLANDTGGSLVLCVSSFDATGLQGALLDPPGVAPDGSFVYTPPPNFNGTTTFTYVATTKVGESCPAVIEGTATVTITVTPVNDAPVAVADSFSALAGHTLTIAAPGVLGNDSDVDGDPLTASLVNDPGHGQVTLAANGGFSYRPNAGYTGQDQFSYKASDGSLFSAIRIVSLTVTALAPPPTPTPAPTPPPVPPTASPEPSPSESPLPTDSGFATLAPVETGPVSASPSSGPVTGPVVGQGGPPILAIAALVLLIGLLVVAGLYFVRSQRAGDEDELEPEILEGEQ